MKRIIFVVFILFALVLTTGCIKKVGDQPQPESTPTPVVSKTYSFKFNLASEVPAELQERFLDAVRKKIAAYGYQNTEVKFVDGNTFSVVVGPAAGVILLEDDFKRFVSGLPTFEIKRRESPDKLVLTEEEKKEMVDYNQKALAKANQLLKEVLKAPETFAEVAKANSEDPGSKDNGGAYKGIKKGQFVPEYEDVIFNKIKTGEIYDKIVETSFGYHIIKKDAETGEGDERAIDTSHILIRKKTESQILADREWLATGLNGLYISKVNPVQMSEGGGFAFQIEFDEEGTQRLAQLTKENLNNQIAIVLDGVTLGTPTITQEITDGKLLITGQFTQEQVTAIAQRLSSGVVNVKVVGVE